MLPDDTGTRAPVASIADRLKRLPADAHAVFDEYNLKEVENKIATIQASRPFFQIILTQNSMSSQWDSFGLYLSQI
jgi:hypothetical protein